MPHVTIRPRRSALALLMGGLCLTALTQPVFAQARPLNLDVEPGTRIAFDESLQFDLDLQMSMNGQQMNMQQKIDSTVTGETRVLEVGADGLPSKVQVTFSPDIKVQIVSMGQEQTQPLPVAGKTLTLTRDGDQFTIEPEMQLDEATRDGLWSYLDLSRGMLPDKPVAPGDTWQGDKALLARGSGGMSPDITFTLDRFEMREGREVALIKTDLKLDGEYQGAAMKGSGAGTMMIDAATGLLLSQKTDTDLKLSGSQEQNGMKADFNGGGKLTAASKNTLSNLDSQAAAPDTTGTATSTTGTSTNPDSPTTPRPAATGDTFADDNLSVTLNGDDVTIRMADDTYPGRITKREGDALTGEFTVDDTTFPFEATRKGNTLTLVSGGTTYTLTRQGGGSPANPLGNR